MFLKIMVSDVDLLQKALEQNDLSPKYREHIKLRIEESSPVDYREIDMPVPSLVAVSIKFTGV
jgi:acyl-CoA thioesterase 8